MNPFRLSTHRGTTGELVVTRTYSNFLYTVTMRTDGAIDVRHGDWLSKYSCAMYSDFTHIHEFARMDKSGKLKRIEGRHALNHIFAGETLYHIPTYYNAHRIRTDDIVITPDPTPTVTPPLSDEEEKNILKATLKDDYDLRGEQLEVLAEIADHYHEADTVVEIGEIIAESAGWISEETAVGATIATGVTAMGLIGAALTSIYIGIQILNANDADRRLAGMQAICYAIPAWAFDDPIPGFPAQLRRNQMAFPGLTGVQRVEPAWEEACDAAVRNMEAKVKARDRSKESYQMFWRALGKFDRKTLVRSLMEARAEELRGVEKDSFLGMDPNQYPN